MTILCFFLLLTANLIAAVPVVFEEHGGEFFSRGNGISLRLDAGGAGIDAIRLEWVNANLARVEGLAATGGYSHYYKEDSKPISTKHYRRVRYAALYPGIDLIFYGNPTKLECDWVVSPGADAGRIRFRVRDAVRLSTSQNGELRILTGSGTTTLGKPVLYQPTAQGRRDVAGSYRIDGDEVSFHTGPYDSNETLIIDPTFTSTYIGGRDIDVAAAVATDPAGNIYLTGYTASGNFPVSPPTLKGTLAIGDADAFVIKLNPTATTVLYATFLGGSQPDYGRAIAVDPSGAAYITGATLGRFPVTTGAYRTTTVDLPTIFVVKLDAAGGALTYATYLDGAGAGLAIAIDGPGNAYVGGYTFTAAFTTTAGVVQTIYGGAIDAFLVKLNPAGSDAVFSTLLGGSAEDRVTGIKVDSARNVFAVGYTSSNNFPTTAGALRQTYAGSTDAFVVKLNPTATELSYSTFLGSPGTDRAQAMDLSVTGEVYVAGQTFSGSFPTTAGAIQTTLGGGSDVFVSKLNAAGSALVYSTLLGGNGSCSMSDPSQTYSCDSAYALVATATGQVWVAGAAGANFPRVAASQSTPGGSGDAFVALIESTGNTLLSSTYIGGSAGDVALGIAYTPANGTVVVGMTQSSDFPVTAGVLQTVSGGVADAFVSRQTTCNVTLGSTGSFFPNTAGTYSVGVIASANCGWVAASNADWVTFTASSGVGNGPITFTVAANLGPFRTAQITVTGQVYTIQQVAGGCVTLGATSSWFPPTVGLYSLPVFATCSWTAKSDSAWVTANGSGTGNGQVFYSLAANATGGARFATIDVSGPKFSINQVGGGSVSLCTFALTPLTGSFDRTGGSASVLVSTQPTCEWTVSNPNSWITLTVGFAGRGDGIVGYTVQPNTGVARTGMLTMGTQSFSVQQTQN